MKLPEAANQIGLAEISGVLSTMNDPAMQRLEDQISWYDSKSNRAQACFKSLKLLEIGSGALIPFLAGIHAPAWSTGSFGVLIVILEGVQHLNQYQQNWITYRSTCESLKHEKYLYLANAGPYSKDENRMAVLAERVESLVSQEHAKWVSTQDQTKNPNDK